MRHRWQVADLSFPPDLRHNYEYTRKLDQADVLKYSAAAGARAGAAHKKAVSGRGPLTAKKTRIIPPHKKLPITQSPRSRNQSTGRWPSIHVPPNSNHVKDVKDAASRRRSLAGATRSNCAGGTSPPLPRLGRESRKRLSMPPTFWRQLQTGCRLKLKP